VTATAKHKNGRRTRLREQGSYRASAAAEEARGDAGRHLPESRRRRQRAEGERGTSTTDLIRFGLYSSLSLSLSLCRAEGERSLLNTYMSIMRSENENGDTEATWSFLRSRTLLFRFSWNLLSLSWHVDSYSHIFEFSI
jgi:hypothetical protein